MSTKVLVCILLVLVILVGLFLFVRVLSHTEKTEDNAQSFRAIQDSQVSHFELFSGDESIKINQNNGIWLVNEYPIDTDHLQRMWDAFAKSTITGPVGNNEKNYEVLGVDDATGIHAIFYLQQNEPIEFIVGNYNSSNNATYIRFKDSKDVYGFNNADIGHLLSPSIDSWRNKIVLSVERQSMSLVELKHHTKSGSFSLSKHDDGGWYIDQKKVSEKNLNTFFPNLSLLRADGFADSEKIDTTPEYTLSLFSTSTDLIARLDFFKHNQGWYVKKDGDKTTYVIPDYRLTNILEGKNTLTVK